MAASTWRRMAGALLLCALMLSNEVMCQDDPADTTDAPALAADTPAMAVATAAQDGVAIPTVAVGGESAASAAPADAADAASAAPAAPADAADAASAAPQSSIFPATIISIALDNSQDGDTSGTSDVITAAPVVEVKVIPDVAHVLRTVVPDVMCVGEEDVPESNAVKATVKTDDCEKTKRVIQANPAEWCHKENCHLKIFQNGNTALVASEDANLATLAKALTSDQLKDQLGVTKTETPSSSSGSSVFVGILVSGLLAALAILLGYFKCQRRTDTKGVRLAEEAHPADQENQGNTLVSVAPLNPPLETPEKPSINGETPEAEKTPPPPPPTNGHSTTKTADTEL
ncbi:uncharacterized protein cd34 isoform X2 [Clinocottus analis]|uniref:uncharacterized protein cd34 isoform X2 n=1 Tax=Clinocottus analis TaxID=304258 RepID=UPI0035C21372